MLTRRLQTAFFCTRFGIYTSERARRGDTL